MKILIVEQPGVRVEALADRLVAAGHQVRQVAEVALALTRARSDAPDLLITALFPEGEGPGDESGLSVAMTAQFHNPALVTILLSDSVIFSHGELFSMLGSLRCVMRRPPEVDDLVEIATHFLAHGPVNCAPSASGPDICGKCLLSEHCHRAARARQAVSRVA